MKTLGLFFLFSKKSLCIYPTRSLFFWQWCEIKPETLSHCFPEILPLKKKGKPTPQFTYVFAELISFLQFHSKQSINQSITNLFCATPNNIFYKFVWICCSDFHQQNWWSPGQFGCQFRQFGSFFLSFFLAAAAITASFRALANGAPLGLMLAGSQI